MLTYEARTIATPDQAWPLLARPALWSSWAPHLRGAWGLGDPEVEPGSVGAVRLLGLLPIPAKILAKEPGRSWTWRVGPVTLVHRVHEDASGTVVAVDLRAPAPVEAALSVTYGPLVQMLVRNLARTAARR
ncbi:MAG TPA: SRPBCC family protein [Solirubrobacteraceae bacterium]|nr:SRPBCC family protein [Solirubrobacteraceae bacterium]